jgi:prevent-host-death family protein
VIGVGDASTHGAYATFPLTLTLTLTLALSRKGRGDFLALRPNKNHNPSINGEPRATSPMRFSTQVKPISYLKSHAAEIINAITENREPMLITQNGEAKLVVMDVKSYEEQAATLALLKILALGNREIEQGRFRSADDVFAKLDEA